MKTDKELLELAAKAAGINYKDGFQIIERGELFNFEPLVIGWNPFYVAEQAIELAEAIKATIQINDDCVTVDAGEFTVCEKVTEYDRHYTNRAIVRAAAAIGERL